VKKMKIGYFISHFPYIDRLNDPDYEKKYAHGGTEIAAYNLAINIAKKHEVDIFTSSMTSKDSVDSLDNIKIYRYGTILKIASANLTTGILYKPLNHKMDIAHAHYNTPYSDYAALRYAKKKNVPFVVTYQNDAPETNGNFIRNWANKIYNKTLIKKVLDGANVIISTSNAFINESFILGDYKEKIEIIPNGINLEEVRIKLSPSESRSRLGLPLDKKIILFFGNIVPYKGPHILLKAISMMKNQINDFIVVFAGRGPMKEELIKMSQKLDIEENIKFTGYIDDKLKYLYFKSADIFCLPSINNTESFGIVNLEAMACGVPIVSTRIGGIPDVVEDGKNGLLTNPNDEKSLAEALIFLMENEEIAKKMGEYGEKKVKNYSWEKIADKTEKVYQNLLS
jgi:glycosyltransferase involved in cell wall biosynthesis